MKLDGFIGFRVDDRMIHGIVATQWIPTLSATRAMVIDDEASENDLIRASLKMAVPPGVALSVIDINKAITNISNKKYKNQRVFCVFKNIKTVYDLFERGAEIPKLNLGNITQNSGDTITLAKTVRISNEEKRMLKEMVDSGVKLVVQFSTHDQEIDVSELVK